MMRRRSSGVLRKLKWSGLAVILTVPCAAETASREWPVPRLTIYPGQVVDEATLTRRTFRVTENGGAGVYEAIDGLLGKVARRTLLAGQPIPHGSVQEANVILQGRQYQMVFRGDGLIITGLGIPLKSGGVGEVVPVRNSESGLVVRARVMPNHTLAVE
jgi:flagellar basal body P-ring formation protein FlgA